MGCGCGKSSTSSMRYVFVRPDGTMSPQYLTRAEAEKARSEAQATSPVRQVRASG